MVIFEAPPILAAERQISESRAKCKIKDNVFYGDFRGASHTPTLIEMCNSESTTTLQENTLVTG